jgi:hypothetical protein
VIESSDPFRFVYAVTDSLPPLLSDAKAGESSSPVSSQRVRESVQNSCVVLLILMLFIHNNNTFQVKSFVDSGNNGLDGVRISPLNDYHLFKL